MRVETMEFDIFIITQNVTFKAIIFSFSRAHISHLQVVNACVYDGVFFVSKLVNIYSNYHDNTAYSSRRLTWLKCQNVDGYYDAVSNDVTQAELFFLATAAYVNNIFISEKTLGAYSDLN